MQSIFTVLLIVLGLDLCKTSRLKRQCPTLFGCQSTTQLPLIPGRTNCVLPEYPDNGKWTIFDGPRKYPGEIVPAKTILQYQCDSQFKLMPESEFSICHTFWNLMPICLKTCPSFPSIQTLHISCELFNKSTSCIDPYEGSTAKVACVSSNVIKYLKCINGSWDALLPPCSECIFQSPDINDETYTDIVPGEFPFMARLYFGQGNTCQGALISECHVVVLQYCNVGVNQTVRLGSFSARTNDSTFQYMKVKEIKHDPSNRIVLLKLEKPVTVNTYVQPISIIESDTIDARVISIGTSAFQFDGNFRRTTMAKITRSECKEKIPRQIIDRDRYLDDRFCLILRNSSMLERGGVFVTKHKEEPCKYSLVGILYENQNYYGNEIVIGDKVYPYLAWIKDGIKETC